MVIKRCRDISALEPSLPERPEMTAAGEKKVSGPWRCAQFGSRLRLIECG
jgi:hypothetical protein